MKLSQIRHEDPVQAPVIFNLNVPETPIPLTRSVAIVQQDPFRAEDYTAAGIKPEYQFTTPPAMKTREYEPTLRVIDEQTQPLEENEEEEEV